MLTFLVVAELSTRLPESAAPLALVIRVAAPGGLLLYFLARGRYPELRGWKPTPGSLAGDTAIGLLGTALWMGPFLLFPSLRPDEPGFDPEQLGASALGLTLTIRAVGYAIVTPFIEELFVRSWLLRFLVVFNTRGDFRKVPIGRFTWTSFLITTAYFVGSHLPWEWGVMLAWTLLTMGWLYYRRHIASLVLVHAVTNGSILAIVALGNGRVRDITGEIVDLWFFV